MQNPGTALSQVENVGAYGKRRFAFAPRVVTAGTGGDGAFIDGEATERCDPDVALSAMPCIPATAVLASGEDAVFERRVQHRDDADGAWADYGTQPADVTIPSLGVAQTVNLDLGDPEGYGSKWNIDLSAAKAQIRIRVKPTLSAGGTDTVAIGASVALAGFDTAPPKRS